MGRRRTADGGNHLPDLFRMVLERFGMISGQVHRRIEIGPRVLAGQLHVLGKVDEHGPRPAGGGDVKRLLHDPRHVLNARDHVMMLGDRLADCDRRRFLEGVAADDVLCHLPRDGDERNTVELRVGNRRHQVGRAGPAGRHANADFSRRAGDSLGRESAPLLVAGQDRADLVLEFQKRLMQRHAGAAGIRENALDTLMHEGFDQDFGPVISLILS